MKKSAEHAWRGNPYKRPGSPYWNFFLTDASGVVRRRSAKTKDLRIAREALAAKLREVEKQKAGHIDRYADTRTMPVAKLVDAYKAHLETEKRAPRYVKETIRQIREFVAFAKITTIPSIVLADGERFVAGVRSRCSPKTRDHYAAALRSFGRWLQRTSVPDAGTSNRSKASRFGRRSATDTARSSGSASASRRPRGWSRPRGRGSRPRKLSAARRPTPGMRRERQSVTDRSSTGSP